MSSGREWVLAGEAPLPPDEPARLAVLQRYRILDTPPEQAFDELVCLAAQLAGTPIALISLVDAHRQWFKARIGLDLAETPREVAFCAHALHPGAEPKPLIVPDTHEDPRFTYNPLVRGAPHLRFYAGAPLVSPEGQVIGTLCVLDGVPRTLGPEQEKALTMLARQVMGQLELRRALHSQAALLREQARAHAALARSQEHLAAVIEAEPECVKVLGEDGTLLEMNPAGLEMMEAERPQDVIGGQVLSIVAPEYRESFWAFHRRICAGERGRFSFEIIGLKGTRRWMETHAVPLRHGPLGRRVHLAITHDVTAMKRARELELREMAERRVAEEALRRGNERYQAVLCATQDVVWDWDRAGGAVTWSERLESMLGHSLSADCEQPSWKQEQVHPEDRERVEASLRTALEQRAVSWSAEYRFRRGNGTYAQVLDRAVVSYAPSGEPTRLVGAMADLTEQRELQTQLSLAERMATVGTLAAGVAHEINNPLCYLLGNLDFVLEALGESPADETRDAAEVRRAIQEAREGAERVRLIVRELKTFSRGDEESIGPVDVHGPLESALLIAANEINHRAVLRRDYTVIPRVQGNEARLAQVFLNLLINAVQALPADGVKRNEIRVVTRLGTEGRVVLEIVDNGQGIPQALQARIFEPFFTTKPIGEGTGLGLWVCHRLITKLGGTIAVDSEPGRGSTFRILLPVADADVPAPPVTV